ncbi:hypothetical protein [Kistimonas asteriae]|uniref:hypothetical protein n=1 Tax=Kistimonas asteriae TaxID=517724 RepID=UPI001BA8CBB0|nr:hypothetical protein [Kistimonas asteriae]
MTGLKQAMLALTFFTLLLTGCSNVKTIPLSDTARQSVAQVVISPEVTVTPDVFYSGPAESAEFALGGLAGAVVGQAGQADRVLIENTMKASDIGVIFTKAFRQQLQASGAFTLAEREAANTGVFRFEIRLYGLGQTQGFSHTLYPLLGVKGVLTDSEGQILWQQYADITPLNAQNTLGYDIKDYLQDPARVSEVFQHVSTVISQRFLETL